MGDGNNSVHHRFHLEDMLFYSIINNEDFQNTIHTVSYNVFFYHIGYQNWEENFKVYIGSVDFFFFQLY